MTINHRFNGSNPPADSAGIYAQAELTFEDAVVEITDENAAIWATNVLNINASYLKATNKKGNYSAIYTRGQNSDIIISGCEFMEPTDVNIETNLYKGKTIFDTNGSVVQDILISPSCTVVFNSNGGTGTMESKKISTLVEYILPECDFTAPTNTGFYKWKINGTLYNAGEEVKINDNTVLYATWYVKEVRKEATAPTIGATPVNSAKDYTYTQDNETVRFEDYSTVMFANYDTNIFIPVFDLLADVISITQKYTEIETDTLATDFTGVLYDFCLPYFYDNHINISKIDKLSEYARNKQIKIEKYYEKAHKIIYPNDNY